MVKKKSMDMVKSAARESASFEVGDNCCYLSFVAAMALADDPLTVVVASCHRFLSTN